MDEVKRNVLLIELTYDLMKKNDTETLSLLKTMVDNDTPAMQKSYEIVINNRFTKAIEEINKGINGKSHI